MNIDPSKPRVAIIVVNYNTANDVLELHRNILSRLGPKSAEALMIVVDNGSEPKDLALLVGSLDGLRGVELIRAERNLGYSGGNNLGLRRAREIGIPYCLISNGDIEIMTDGFVEVLISDFLGLKGCGLLGPRIVLANGKEQMPVRRIGVVSSVLRRRGVSYSAPAPVYATVGCCIFGATEVFERFGYLDEKVFLYYEEVILAERVAAAGFKWYFTPHVLVLHRHKRKNSSIRSLLKHKRYELESSVYYFRVSRGFGPLRIGVYRSLFFGRLVLYVLYTCLHPTLSGR
jgi:GT2 family glycosyltransferase